MYGLCQSCFFGSSTSDSDLDDIEYLSATHLQRPLLEDRAACLTKALDALELQQDTKHEQAMACLQSSLWQCLPEERVTEFFERCIRIVLISNDTTRQVVVDACLKENQWQNMPAQCQLQLVNRCLTSCDQKEEDYVVFAEPGHYLSRGVLFRHRYQDLAETIGSISPKHTVVFDGSEQTPPHVAFFKFGLWLMHHYDLTLEQRYFWVDQLNQLPSKYWLECFSVCPDAFLYLLAQSQHINGWQHAALFGLVVVFHPLLLDLYYRLIYPIAWIMCSDLWLDNMTRRDQEDIILPIITIATTASLLMMTVVICAGGPAGAVLLLGLLSTMLVGLLVANLLRHYVGEWWQRYGWHHPGGSAAAVKADVPPTTDDAAVTKLAGDQPPPSYTYG